LSWQWNLGPLEAIEHPNIPAEGARVSEWKRDLMNGIRQERVEPPANVTAAYRLASSYIRIHGSSTAAGNSQLVANAFIRAINKDIKKASGYRKESGGDAEKKSKTRPLISVIHAVKLAIELPIWRQD